MLEIVGVTGVVHMGQIQSGLRNAIRIAQGGHVSLSRPFPFPDSSTFIRQIKIKINTEMPVQVDGEPWIQAPGEVVVLKSALKVRAAQQPKNLVNNSSCFHFQATMLRKSKMKRRNTEPALSGSEKSSAERSSVAYPEKSSITERPDE